MENFYLRNFSLELVRLEGINDVQLTFDDSYICYASNFAAFQSSFLLIFTNGKLLLKKLFSRTCTFRGKK